MQMGQDNDFSNDQKKIHVNPSRLTSEANESRKYYSDIEKFIEAWQFTKDNSTGEKRLQFGLDQAILDFGRMLGSKLVINEKEWGQGKGQSKRREFCFLNSFMVK